jgi:hypothetical protein
MTEEEFAVVAFLECNPEVYFSRREIARRAVKRQVYEENPHWADAALTSLKLQDLIDQDESGACRCKGGGPRR